MSLYETMFSQFDITVSQLLVTSFDFTSPERRKNIQHVISQLLALGIVPLLNENDAVSANQGYQTFGKIFSDNDSLASLVAVEMSAQLLILLTDVNGVYDRPPSEPDAQIIDIFRDETTFKAGDKSLQGRGGIGAKVDAALSAIRDGVQAVVIAAGHDATTIGKIIDGEKVGTLFLSHSSVPLESSEDSQPTASSIIESSLAKQVARLAKDGSRQLSKSSGDTRSSILLSLSRLLEQNSEAIICANREDVIAAEQSGVAVPLLNRLKLSEAKISTLVNGIRAIASANDPIHSIISRMELADGLVLEKVTCPIGALLIIFESRPDCLPQIAALAIKSGNGLVLKGGKEAERTNTILLDLVKTAISEGSNGQISNTAIGMVANREDVRQLLKLGNFCWLLL
jgi:delta-1-pyrroline-5-carboxylate synthetase